MVTFLSSTTGVMGVADSPSYSMSHHTSLGLNDHLYFNLGKNKCRVFFRLRNKLELSLNRPQNSENLVHLKCSRQGDCECLNPYHMNPRSR